MQTASDTRLSNLVSLTLLLKRFYVSADVHGRGMVWKGGGEPPLPRSNHRILGDVPKIRNKSAISIANLLPLTNS